MPKEKSNQKTKRRRWTFSLEAAGAEEVLLMGDFNNVGSDKDTKLRHRKEGNNGTKFQNIFPSKQR
jgi:endonuclease/exonuclease/phosphatase family metal-dependent hydrolase